VAGLAEMGLNVSVQARYKLVRIFFFSFSHFGLRPIEYKHTSGAGISVSRRDTIQMVDSGWMGIGCQSKAWVPSLP
jgi:hypothetical protein